METNLITNSFCNFGAIDADIAQEIEVKQQLYNKGKLYWLTESGKKILIQDMRNTHVSNTIAYLEVKPKTPMRDCIINILKREEEKRMSI